ncbi:MAG: Rrf2 family transcriptional regulator [Aromatoleum sp.]|jgi:Rrf2 family nitric oxide-sensitive transcriptional repressor|uniref:RrF2 family transcriptional regulator n=1 Tax=Aromatoleum sp. TaxID=2307007 RepID=UPI002893A468|nr:Rrf2 family transcriptional regulator [Aromatoleum sp.]MDT3669774.1 Rrf2 family transcriptional regulator [Aromatoleum sp.]
MHITQHTDYALRVLIYLAANTDRLVTIAEVSQRFDISRSHLMKVANQLVREGFVEGLRGKGGGLRLARPAEQIAIGAVVRRMERGMELVECFGHDSNCLLTSNCKLKGVLATALEAFLQSLDRASLADVIEAPQKKLLYFAKPDAPPPARKAARARAAKMPQSAG